MNLGFIILSTDANYGNLRFTAKCLEANFPSYPYICVTRDKIYEEDMHDLKQYCAVFRGGNDSLSFINEGNKRLNADWKLVIKAGVNIKYSFWKKYLKFLTSEKDILYSVINKKYLFDEATINGLLFHDRAFKDIGDFTNEPFSKLCWANNAIAKSYNLKGIVGVKL